MIPAMIQVDVIDAELLKPWERKRQEYKQRKKVRMPMRHPLRCGEQGHIMQGLWTFSLMRKWRVCARCSLPVPLILVNWVQ